ncbi:MAG: RsmD family RNA methyltransferase, partial [Planctomycetota bacterium]|nr:RsmD family RNA methyltransferase [Planctomycetota bacterium]
MVSSVRLSVADIPLGLKAGRFFSARNDLIAKSFSLSLYFHSQKFITRLMSLRVIAGQYRRRILKTPSDDSTRPYTDRVRQIVFDRLHDFIPNARVADVFS